MSKKRRTQKERTESTKRKILSAATKLFAKRGFRDVALEDVVKRSGLTRGALYHHFGSKEQLFIGIVEEVERGLAHRILEAAKVESDPLDQLKAGLEAFLNTCLDPAVQRILLLDAPIHARRTSGTLTASLSMLPKKLDMLHRFSSRGCPVELLATFREGDLHRIRR